jgi:hypothetical protein
MDPATNISEVVELETKKMIPEQSGYRYKDDNGNEMAEYHIDTCHVFEKKQTNKQSLDGG